MSIFGGTMSRGAYAAFAIPIMALHYGAGGILARFVPLVFSKLGATLATIGMWMMGFYSLLFVLLIVLTIVSAKRLRDIGSTGWLALPLLLRSVVAGGVAFYQSQAMIHAGTTVAPAMPSIALWLIRGFYIYGLALVLVLLIVPGRRKPSAIQEPAAAF